MSGAEHTAASCVSANVAYVFGQYPNTARRAGRHDLDGRLPQSCARSATAALTWARAAAGVASRPSLKAFHDRLMRCGNAPLTTVWRYYLDGEHGGTAAGAGGPTTNTEVP